MNDRDDDEASGVPERAERTDSGRLVTESGRHVNRNVVPRGSPRDERDAIANRPPGEEDAFDDVTPVLPQAPSVFDVDTPTHHVFDIDTPAGQRARDVFDAVTPRRLQPRGIYRDADRRDADRPDADRRDADRRDGDPPLADEPPAEREPVRTSERWPRLVLPDGEAPPPEAERPPERARRTTPVPQRASTEPGHVEPRRRPTTPPPGSPPAEASVEVAGDAERPRRLPTERGTRTDEARPPSQHGPRIDEPARRAARAASAKIAAPAVGPALDRALRIAAVLAVLGLGAAGLAQPDSVLRGGIAWLAFLFFVLAGWGTIVARLARAADPDVGLRAVLGAAGYLAVAGLAIAAGVLTRPVIVALIGLGLTGFAWRELTGPTALWHRIRDGLVFVRNRPALGVFIVVLALFALVRMLGAVAALDRNPWDDDIAYIPLVKRLLDAGDLVEPFSFRRLGAYGGQIALQALGAARGSLANVHLIDKGLGLGLALLAMLGHARERRTQPMWIALIALVVLVLPDTAINTASYWTGVAAFIALYRCVVRAQWPLVGLVAAATCTLRQNFLVTVAVFLAAVLIARLVTQVRTAPFDEVWRDERRAWAWVAAIALAALVPWWIAAQLSSHTFLFPIVDGTWNHELSLAPGGTSWTQELEFLVMCCVDTSPLVVIPILALVVAFVSDRRLGRPLAALVIASALGFVMLVHGFLGSEAFHLWRYAFGFATALAIVLVIELGADDDRVVLAPLGRWIVLAAFVLQLVVGRGALPRQASALFEDLREAAAIDRQGDPNARAEQRRYRAMQAALPHNAPAVVMLDDPALLDFGSHQLANLDTPGFASPGPQLPAFRGAEALRAYLVDAGYRYAAFVRPERSRYAFRRGFWVQRMFTDSELFQIMSAYTIDAIDSLAELATTTRVLYDDDGLVVLDLGRPAREATRRTATGDEPTRRGAWVRELADREGLRDAWSLNTRADLRFEDGTGAVRYVDGSIDDPRWYEVTHPRPEPAARGTAILPMYRRAHLRVRGTTDMRLALRAAVALNTVYTHPRLDVSLDGELLISAVADATGRYAIEVTVPRGKLAGGWHDLYLVFSSYVDPGRDVRELRIARLESVEWSPP